jgi:hypothetical protein
MVERFLIVLYTGLDLAFSILEILNSFGPVKMDYASEEDQNVIGSFYLF